MHAASLKIVQKCRFSLRYVSNDRNESALAAKTLVPMNPRILETRHINIVASGQDGAARRAGRILCYARPLMNILLVEDSDEVSCITVEYLHELGHRVVAVAEAETAITQLENEPFDAVMTDIRLPGMSGIELARALVKNYPNLPVVIASGYGALNVEYPLSSALSAKRLLSGTEARLAED